MKNRLIRLLLLSLILTLCLPYLAACSGAPSKATVEQCAQDVLRAVVAKDTAALQALANPDYAGYFSETEMDPYYAQYTEWGVCDTGNTVGSLKRTFWQTGDYYGDRASEAEYTVSIGGILYKFEIVVADNKAGVGLANFELERIG